MIEAPAPHRAATACLAAALALALAAPPAAAQSQRLAAAWETLISEEEPDIAPAEIAKLNTIAYHAAVARLCEGFDLDVEKIAAASNEVVAAAVAGLEGEALLARHADVLISLGATHGLFLAEGSLHPEAFCAAAAETRDDPEFADLWR